MVEQVLALGHRAASRQTSREVLQQLVVLLLLARLLAPVPLDLVCAEEREGRRDIGQGASVTAQGRKAIASATP